MRIKAEDIERFWAKVLVRSDDECWLWNGYITKNGYGQIRIGRSHRRAHRIAWMIHNKKLLPKGTIVRHLCHNKICCNPHHLQTGTAKDNSADSRKANIKPRPPTKISDELKAKIVEWYAGGISAYQMSKKLNIREERILSIARKAGLEIRPPGQAKRLD